LQVYETVYDQISEEEEEEEEEDCFISSTNVLYGCDERAMRALSTS